jgi:hypothetical protein
MTRRYWFLLLAGVVVGLIISGRYALLAQDRADTPQPNSRSAVREKSGELPIATVDRDDPPDRQPVPRAGKDSASAVPLQEALLRPYRFPFARPTSLEQVCAHLKETLKGAVVLDLAALDRKSVEPDHTVQLELDGVRLKTGLKLLLDQVGLTYHVVAEDNLMIITDQEGSEDPADRIWAELRTLHRDLHAVQDAVDDLGEYLGVEGGGGAHVRKPTIIEEMPENNFGGEKPGIGPEKKPGRGGEKLDGAGAPLQGSRPLPLRVPLAGPRRSL